MLDLAERIDAEDRRSARLNISIIFIVCLVLFAVLLPATPAFVTIPIVLPGWLFLAARVAGLFACLALMASVAPRLWHVATTALDGWLDSGQEAR